MRTTAFRAAFRVVASSHALACLWLYCTPVEYNASEREKSAENRAVHLRVQYNPLTPVAGNYQRREHAASRRSQTDYLLRYRFTIGS